MFSLTDKRLNQTECKQPQGDKAGSKHALQEWTREREGLVQQINDIKNSSEQTQLQCNQNLEFYQNHISKMERRHEDELNLLRREVTEAILGETSIAAENAILLENIQALNMKLYTASKMAAEKESSRPTKTNNESLQNVSDLGDSRLGIQKGFESMAAKTNDSAAEELLTEYLDNLDKQTEQFLKMSHVFSRDFKTYGQSSLSTFNSKCREYADNLYEAGINLQNTLSQLKRFRKTWAGKFLRTNTLRFIAQAPFTSEGQANMTENDSFARRVNNQSLLRDVSCSSLNPKEDRKRTVCDEVGRILKERKLQPRSKRSVSNNMLAQNSNYIDEDKSARVDTSTSVKRIHRHNRSALPTAAEKTDRSIASRTPEKSILLTRHEPPQPIVLLRLTNFTESSRRDLVKEDDHCVISRHTGNKYTFSRIADANISNKHLYELFEFIKPMVDRVFEGKSGSVFSVGGMQSGKTYCIQGVKTEPGLLPLVICTLFKNIDKRNLCVSVRCSIVEVDANGLQVDLLKDYPDGSYGGTIEQSLPTVD